MFAFFSEECAALSGRGTGREMGLTIGNEALRTARKFQNLPDFCGDFGLEAREAADGGYESA